MKKKHVVKMAVTALLAAIMCVIAPFTVPIGAIPLTLGTFALYLISTVVDRKIGTAAILLYILLGLVGVPVFTGWTGGFSKLVGPTGGYIIGYIPCAYLGGLLADKAGGHKWVVPLGMALGTAVLYAFGTAWYMVQAGVTLAAALASCVVPFLIGDLLKIIVATVVAVPVRAQMRRMFKD